MRHCAQVADREQLRDRLVRRLDDEPVARRAFGIPQPRRVDREPRLCVRGERAVVRALVEHARRRHRARVRHRLTLGAEHGHVDAPGQTGPAAREIDGDPRADGLVIRAVFDVRVHKIVADHPLGTREQIDIAEDAAHAQFVLVFEIAAVTPFEHEHHERVFAGRDVLGHVEFARGMRDLRIADELAVEPHIETAVHALEVEVGARGGFARCVVECAAVDGAGVVRGHVRRVERERVARVRVLVVVVAVHLPHARHGQCGVVGAGVEVHVEEARGVGGVRGGDLRVQIVDAAVVAELPVAAEQLQAVGVEAVVERRVGGARRGDEVRAVRLAAHMQRVEILIIPRNEHADSLALYGIHAVCDYSGQCGPLIGGAMVSRFSMADCILCGLFDHAGPSTTVWPRNTCTGRAVPHTARDGAHP